MTDDLTEVHLQPWSESDFWLLLALNAPELTEHLGGPETEQKLADRQQRYVAMSADRTGKGRMFRIVGPGGQDAGSIGFWERDWQGQQVYESGWGVLPAFQRRGIAVAAARAVVERAREQGTHRHLHAFPSVDHPASNAVCRRAGFLLRGECAFEYPVGHPMRCNDWRLDLEAAPSPRPGRDRP